MERLLANEYALGQEKAKALYLIGEIHMSESRPDLAIPYFQRLYVMHGRWRDWVAKAYYRSGEAFEKLNDQLSARRTYQELAEREDLAGFEETRRPVAAWILGGPLPGGASAICTRDEKHRSFLASSSCSFRSRITRPASFRRLDRTPSSCGRARLVGKIDGHRWTRAFGCEDYCHRLPALRADAAPIFASVTVCARM